jgi:hypothetical protein
MGSAQQLDRTETNQNGLSAAAYLHHGDAEAWVNGAMRLDPWCDRQLNLGQFNACSQDTGNGRAKAKPRQDRS